MANYQNLGLTYNRDTLFIGSHLGSDSPVVPLWVAPCKCELISIKLLNGAAIAAHTENYGTLTITNELTDASGTTALTSDTTKTVAVTALVERTLTLTSTAANRIVARGEVLSATWTEAGTGADLTNASIIIEWAPTAMK